MSMEPHNEWQKVRLDEVSEIILGQSPPGSTYNTDGEGLPFFQGKAEFGKESPTPVKWCTQPKKIAEANDILISVRAPVGPTNTCPTRACIGRGLAAIRPHVDVPTKYLLYALKSSVSELESKATGTTFSSISGSVLRAHQIMLAPSDQRMRIVAEIEKQFTRLDAGVKALNRLQANLKRYRSSVLKAACEGKLVPTEAELAQQEGRDYETGAQLLERILRERREKFEAEQKASGSKKKYKEPAGPETDGLPELPEGWCWASVDQLSTLINGDRGKNYPSKSQFVETGIPFINAGDIQDGKLTFHEMNYITRNRYDLLRSGKIKKGDIIFCLRGSLGKAAVIEHDNEGAIASSLVIIRTGDCIATQYLHSYLLSPFARRIMSQFDNGTAQPNLSAASLKRFVLPLPPLQEQARIVNALEEYTSQLDKTTADIVGFGPRTHSLRQSILREAFSGKTK